MVSLLMDVRKRFVADASAKLRTEFGIMAVGECLLVLLELFQSWIHVA